MLYTVSQVASKLSVSKIKIYNKLRLKQFRDKTVKKEGQIMINDNLFKLIKDSLKDTFLKSPS
ncbi:MAG: hypothetical protein MUO60_17460 [Clostridiaceae bacterium]|nr:hypothetical protein [Clostridiaceae bacterium]